LYRERLNRGVAPSRCLETFDRDAALSETIYLALRTAAGVDDTQLQQRFGVTLEQAFPEAMKATAPWLCRQGGRTRMPATGWLLYDRLIQSFL